MSSNTLLHFFIFSISIMDWFWYAIVSSISFTAYSIVIRKLLTGKSDAKAFTILHNLLTAVFLLLFLPFTGTFLNLEMQDFLLLFLGTILLAVASFLFIVGRQLEDVSIVSVIRQLSIIFIFFGGIIFFNEQLTITKIIGLVLLVTGTLLVLWKHQEFRVSKGMIYIFIATIAMSIDAFVAKSLITSKISPILYSSSMFFIGSIWLLLFIPKSASRVVTEAKNQKLHIVLVSMISAFSVGTLILGYQAGDISKVFPVYSSYVTFTVIAGMIFLHERSNMRYKIIGSLITLLGVILLRLF